MVVVLFEGGGAGVVAQCAKHRSRGLRMMVRRRSAINPGPRPPRRFPLRPGAVFP